jgi:hypothetical protein
VAAGGEGYWNIVAFKRFAYYPLLASVFLNLVFKVHASERDRLYNGIVHFAAFAAP